MKKPTIRIYTTVDEFIDREMNAAEFAQYKIDNAEAQAEIDQEVIKAAAKSALLEKLGITEDEAKLLLS
jgi:hypothetical protein